MCSKPALIGTIPNYILAMTPVTYNFPKVFVIV